MLHERLRILGGALILAMAMVACSPVSDEGEPAPAERSHEAGFPSLAPGTAEPANAPDHPAENPADDPAEEPAEDLADEQVLVSLPTELIAPDGRVFLVPGEDRSPSLYVSVGGEIRQIAHFADIHPSAFWPLTAFAPDRKHVAVIPDPSSGFGTRLLLLTVDGDVVFEKSGTFSSVAWHPSGKTLAALLWYQERSWDPPLATVVEYALDGTETVVTADYPYVQEVLGYSPSGDALYVTYLLGPVATTLGPGLNIGEIDLATGELSELLASDWPDRGRYLYNAQLRVDDDAHVVITFVDQHPKTTKARLGVMPPGTGEASWLHLPDMPEPWIGVSSYAWSDDGLQVAWRQGDQVWLMEMGSEPIHVATTPISWWEWEIDSLTADGELWMYNRQVGYIRLDPTVHGYVLPSARDD